MEKKRKETLDSIAGTYSRGLGLLEECYSLFQAGKDNDAMKAQINAARNDLDVREMLLDVGKMDDEERKYFSGLVAPIDKKIAEISKKTTEYLAKKLEEKMKKHFPNGDSEPHPEYIRAYM